MSVSMLFIRRLSPRICFLFSSFPTCFSITNGLLFVFHDKHGMQIMLSVVYVSESLVN